MKRSGRDTVNAELIQGIKEGRINVPPSVAVAILERPAKKPPLKREQPAPKPPVDRIEPAGASRLETARREALIAEQEKSFHDPNPRPGSAGAGIVCRSRARTLPGEMNKLEAGYSEVLEGRKRAGEILDYWYEEIRLKVGVGSWYTPDFAVTFPDGRRYLVEVKPFRYDDDGAVKTIANEDSVAKVKGCLLRHPYPILWALGRAIAKRDGGGYEWREDWAGDIKP